MVLTNYGFFILPLTLPNQMPSFVQDHPENSPNQGSINPDELEIGPDMSFSSFDQLSRILALNHSTDEPFNFIAMPLKP